MTPDLGNPISEYRPSMLGFICHDEEAGIGRSLHFPNCCRSAVSSSGMAMLKSDIFKFTWYNFAVVAFVALGGLTYGFGFGVFVSSIGQPGFYKYFKLDRTYTP
jgi:hypothetical protein